MRKMSFVLLCLLAGIMGAKAQIGYQIALLNTATGEARANETVTVSVSLSNSANEVFYSETKTATTNDFGILSLSIGNADTFKSVDFSKMPFFIEVSANGVIIGKSQILSVPIAEYAKRTGELSNEMLEGTWIHEVEEKPYVNSGTWYSTYTDQDGNSHEVSHDFTYVSYSQESDKLIFYSNGLCKCFCNSRHWTVGFLNSMGKPADYNDEHNEEKEFTYSIEGNHIMLWRRVDDDNRYTYQSSPAFELIELRYNSALKILKPDKTIMNTSQSGGVLSKQSR